jgi:FAD/FMN-containing dehydrogenase
MTITRRAMLKACAATAALGACGNLGGFDVVRAASAASAGRIWRNKHLNLNTSVSQYHDVWNSDGPASGAEYWRNGCTTLRSILDEAQHAGRRVRAVGSRWSLSPVAVCPDVMVNTVPLNFHAIGLPAQYVTSTAVDPAHLVFAQCGTSVLELSARLESRGLSLATSGASNGQTICGAISTGTHGSARRVGSMQDYMLGLHVLAEDGQAYWIEPASKPVVSDAFCEYLGATLISDDRLFRAAVVGFGSFGIIHAVLFEAVPIYLLEVHRRRMDWPDVARAAGTLDTSALGLPYAGVEPFHFEVALNPYETGPGGRGALVTAMYKMPFRGDIARKTRRPVDGVLVPGIDLLGISGRFATVMPSTIPRGVSRVFEGLVRSRDELAIGTHGEIFDATELKGKSLSSEVGVPLEHAGAAIDTLVEEAGRYNYPGMLGMRYVRQSSAFMAFTRFETTCTIEMTGAGSVRTLNFYDRAWAALDRRRIPFTVHWGKVHNLSCRNLRQRWGGAVDEWVAARRAFLGPAGRAMFSNDLLAACELNL